MRTILLPLLCASCGAYRDRVPFRTTAPGPDSATAPPGVHWSIVLDGVTEVPRSGVPVRYYEMTLDVQHEDPNGPHWITNLARVSVDDDEGHRFKVSSVTVDGPAAGLLRYTARFRVDFSYRFQSIGRASIRWPLRTPGRPVLHIKSNFLN